MIKMDEVCLNVNRNENNTKYICENKYLLLPILKMNLASVTTFVVLIGEKVVRKHNFI